MERPPKKYVCEKCGYLGDTSEHEGCDYLAWTTGEQLYIDQLERDLALLKASPASAPEGFTMSEPTILPDGSGFGTMSFPLPKDHWIYKEREYEDGAIEPNDLPAPILTHSFRRQVIAAIRYAVRSATNCGKEDDFDPDALVQNAVYALCGPYGKAAPTPPVSEDRKDAPQEDYFADACRLALELECLLLDCKDTAVTAKWWDSAHEALEQHRERIAAMQEDTP